MISLTGVCSSLVVAAPCFVGVNVVGGSKSKGILVSAKAMLTLSVIPSSCCNANIILAKKIVTNIAVLVSRRHYSD